MANRRDRNRSRRSRRLRWISLAFLCLCLLLVAAVVWAYLSVEIPDSGSRQTVLFYSRQTDLVADARLDLEDLTARLRRLGYLEVAEPTGPGEFRLILGGAEIHLRPFGYPGYTTRPGRVRVWIEGGRVASVKTIDILSVDDLRLEPERIAGFEGRVGAFLNPIRLERAPRLLTDALLAVEDRRFYHHPGIDPIGTARALWTDVRRSDRAQGGSTLTQQLARSLFLHNRKTIARKLQEAFLAIGLELRYSKREILEAYLNAVYWGTWGTMEIRGAREAARYYLGTELEEADPAGIALLVGLVRAPNATSPYTAPDRARGRRDRVLRLLHDRGILSEEATRAALATPLRTDRPPDRIADASYFLDAARKEVERRAPAGTLDREGTRIFTTLDPRDQTVAVTSLRDGLERLEARHRSLRRKKGPLQGAVAVLDPVTGEVRALVGGRDYPTGPWNRAVDARRQPGSAFKPFVYLAAFQHPLRKDGTYWTPATIVRDEPIEIPGVREEGWPSNYDRKYLGPMTVRAALELSRNVPTAAIGYEVGLKNVAGAARDLGIRSPLREFPSLALGASEVNLLEITAAYGALANLGRARTPRLVRGILDSEDRSVPLTALDDPPGIIPQEAFLLTSILEGVMTRGTGEKARQLGLRGTIAGKTGTTDGFRDAWFIGYTPRRVAGVWIGFDREEVTGLSGGSAALPIWASIMKQIQVKGGEGRFARPDGIVTVAIDPETGLLATGDCPAFIQESFLEGTEPVEECRVHRPGLFDRLKRFFRL